MLSVVCLFKKIKLLRFKLSRHYTFFSCVYNATHFFMYPKEAVVLPGQRLLERKW